MLCRLPDNTIHNPLPLLNAIEAVQLQLTFLQGGKDVLRSKKACW